MESRFPSALDDFLFDLRGYLVLENAVAPDLLSALNTSFDGFPPIPREGWWGNAQRRDYTDETGFELHNCVEVGEPFEQLIDHPSWINHIRRYCGEEDSYVQGLFIDECIASIRTSGGITQYTQVGIAVRCEESISMSMACFGVGSVISS